MRAIAYVRVSTGTQAEEGVSLPAQRAKIERWAAAHDHQLVAIYEDAGLSGGLDVDERPGLAAALVDLTSDRADALVVVKLDRLARSMRILVTLVEDVFKSKALVSLSESVDTGTAMGRAFVQFCGIMAELEKGLISERTRAALAHLKSQGVRLGAPPLGAAPGEAETVARIHELREEGLTLSDIAVTLTHEGRKTKRGGRWAPETVRKILNQVGRNVAC